MFKLNFKNAIGESIELFGRPYRLIRVEGLGDVEADIQTQKAPYQDGVTVVDTVLEPRYMTIELKIIGKDQRDTEAKRKQLASIFNPKLGEGTLFYESENVIRQISAVSESVPIFPDGSTNRKSTFQKAIINLICPSPYWQGFVESAQMSYLMGGLRFPLRLPTSFSTRGFRRNFINNGDVPTPIQVAFRGPAYNPTVRNVTTGEFITVNRELGENDVLYIDTAFGVKQVEIERANGEREEAFHYIDLASTFFQLEVGTNMLEYRSNNDSTTTRVEISYRNRFVGV